MLNNGFTDKYYELGWPQAILSISPSEERRIRETLALIPEDCSSVLDVGYGDGRITNRLITKYKKVCGLDSSEEALKHVKSDKVLGSLDSLQFPDKSL